MAVNAPPAGMGRRQFLRALASTAVVASATGTAAGLLFQRDQGAPFIAPPAAPPRRLPAPTAAASTGDSPALLGRLAQAEAEVVRLRGELAVAQANAGSAASSLASSDQVWQGRVEEANSQAGLLAERVSILGGLVALYEQLDQVDIGQQVQDGLDSVGAALAEAMDEVPTVAEGLAAGRQALDNLEASLPALQTARGWVEGQLGVLGNAYAQVEQVLRNTAELSGTFLVMLGEWFQSLLRWLPFGLGDRAARVVAAVTDLLAQTPPTLTGLRDHVAVGLDVWLAHDGQSEPRLQREIVKPVREQALERAQGNLDRTQALEATYRESLAGPVQVALDQRRAIREAIAEYRLSNQV